MMYDGAEARRALARDVATFIRAATDRPRSGRR